MDVSVLCRSRMQYLCRVSSGDGALDPSDQGDAEQPGLDRDAREGRASGRDQLLERPMYVT